MRSCSINKGNEFTISLSDHFSEACFSFAYNRPLKDNLMSTPSHCLQSCLLAAVADGS